jgi:hypothetical protein
VKCDYNINSRNRVGDGEYHCVDSAGEPSTRTAGGGERGTLVIHRDDHQSPGTLLQAEIADDLAHLHQSYSLHHSRGTLSALPQDTYFCAGVTCPLALASEALLVLSAVHCAIYLPGHHFFGHGHITAVVLGQFHGGDDGMEDVYSLHWAFWVGWVCQ